MPRPPLLAVLTILLPSCGAGRGHETFAGAPIVLVSIDTLRADRLPAYGYRSVETPHLDRFRRDAILYENAYSHCPMTLPSHASMLTGLLPPEHGVRNNVGFVFDGRAHATIPGLLKAKGYATGAAVSSYVLRAETGLGAVFDDYEDSIDPRPGAVFSEHQRSGWTTASFAKDWILAHKDKPFFYFFHLYEPHVPYEPPEPFRSRYRDAYDGEVATADAIVGDLLEHLRGIGVYDKAVIVVTSDHGEGLGDHGEDQHSILLYVEAIRVPLFLKLPRSRRGGESVRALAQHIDLLPTFTDLVGLQPPKGLRGASLLRLDGARETERLIYSETLYPRLHLGWSELRSVMGQRHHFIDSPRSELYDVPADPGEKQDLAAAQGTRVADLKRALERFPSGKDTLAEVDPEAARRLAALGYVGMPRDRGQAALPNPRDNLRHLAAIREGFRLAASGRSEDAIEVLEGIVRESPAMVEVWIKLGEVLYETGRHGEAAAAFQEALSRTPVLLSDVVIEMGYARLKSGKFAEAASAADLALASNPTRARELLARIALARGRLPEAEQQARAALGTRSVQPSSLLALAEVLVARGDLPQALQVLDHAQKRAGELRLATAGRLEFLRGDALARSGRPQDAEVAYRREIASFPGNLQAYANIAVLYFLQRNQPAVDDVIAEMVRANPSPQAYTVAVRTFEALGDRRRAALWRNRAGSAAKGAIHSRPERQGGSPHGRGGVRSRSIPPRIRKRPRGRPRGQVSRTLEREKPRSGTPARS